jgi:hypothetical protein
LASKNSVPLTFVRKKGDELREPGLMSLTRQAWALLRAEVAAQVRLLSSASPAEAASARQVLEVLRRLPVLAGVRDPTALAHLPEPERQTWQTFWQEVEELLRQQPVRPAGG